MTLLLNSVAAFLLLTLLAALIRLWRGPTPADRMLTSQLFGTTGVALLLVLSHTQASPALMDVALTLAILSVLAIVAFVTRVVRIEQTPSADQPGDDREARHD